MELAMIGLGRMGGNMARRLMRAGHRVVGYNRSPESTRGLAEEGLDGAFGLEEVAQKLAQPRIAWLMVPAGDPTEKTIAALMGILAPGDTIVDGGNTFYKDDTRRSYCRRQSSGCNPASGPRCRRWSLRRRSECPWRAACRRVACRLCRTCCLRRR